MKACLFCMIFVVVVVVIISQTSGQDRQKRCPKSMTFGWGDAVNERLRCTVDPNGKPINKIAMQLLSSTISRAGHFANIGARSDESNETAANFRQRSGRLLGESGADLSTNLISQTMFHNGENENAPRPAGRSDNVCGEGCSRVNQPETCCEVRTEVAYPQFGQSAITEETFTIIQDFPDFVQPVFKRVCVNKLCNYLRGNCTQKYVPHAVFSAPSGKFGSLFGQDYLLVESGCECTLTPVSSVQVAGQPTRPSIAVQRNINNETVDSDAVNANRNSIALK